MAGVSHAQLLELEKPNFGQVLLESLKASETAKLRLLVPELLSDYSRNAITAYTLATRATPGPEHDRGSCRVDWHDLETAPS